MRQRTRYAVVSVDGEPSGVRIAFSERGRRAGMPVVFVHGLFSSRRPWERVVFPKLYISKRLIALDLPGFGDSPPLTQPLTLDRCVEVLKAFLETRSLRDPVLVGNSFGGTVVLTFGARHPDAVSGIIAQGAIISGADFPWHHRRVVDLTRFLVSRGDGVASAVRKIAFPVVRWFVRSRVIGKNDLRRATAELIRIGEEDYRRASFRAGIELVGDLVRLDLSDALRGYRVPLMLIDGGRIGYPPVNTLWRIASLVPRCPKIGVIGGAGHIAPFVAPKAFAMMLLGFVRNSTKDGRKGSSPSAS